MGMRMILTYHAQAFRSQHPHARIFHRYGKCDTQCVPENHQSDFPSSAFLGLKRGMLWSKIAIRKWRVNVFAIGWTSDASFVFMIIEEGLRWACDTSVFVYTFLFIYFETEIGMVGRVRSYSSNGAILIRLIQ